MGSDHITVNLAALESTAHSLSILRGEFEKAGDIAEAAHGDLGSDPIWHAVHGFATDWKYHKQKLTELMKSIEEMAGESHDTYLGVDNQLAAKLLEADERASTHRADLRITAQ